jgi:DNA-binding transcriptional LysR family regulator
VIYLDPAGHPSILAAAQALGLWQAALYQQVGRLERACGGPLVNRRPRPAGTAILTPLGQQPCRQAATSSVSSSTPFPRLRRGSAPQPARAAQGELAQPVQARHDGCDQLIRVIAGRLPVGLHLGHQLPHGLRDGTARAWISSSRSGSVAGSLATCWNS